MTAQTSVRHLFTAILCLGLTGCGPSEKQQQESQARLDALSAKLDAIQNVVQSRGAPLRWAYVNKSRVVMATAEWSRRKAEEAEQNENLPPETKEKLAELARLSSQQRQMQMSLMSHRSGPPVPGQALPTDANPELQELSKKVVALRSELADVLNRRAKAQIAAQYPIDALVKEYAGDRFDLVLDNSFGTQYILVHGAAEVPDITNGVIKLFQEKEKASAPTPAASAPPSAKPSP